MNPQTVVLDGAPLKSAQSSVAAMNCNTEAISEFLTLWKIHKVLTLIIDFTRYFPWYMVSLLDPSLFIPEKKGLRDFTRWLTYDHYIKASKQM